MKRTATAAALLLLLIAGCEQIIGLDEMKVGPDGGDADSDSDIDGDGDDCSVTILSTIYMEGYCLPISATANECEGGVYVSNPQGTCPNDQLKCCIDTDQCDRKLPPRELQGILQHTDRRGESGDRVSLRSELLRAHQRLAPSSVLHPRHRVDHHRRHRDVVERA